VYTAFHFPAPPEVIVRVLLGLLLIVAAVAFLIFSIVPAMTDNNFVLGVLQPLYCESGDHLSAEQIVTHDSDGTGYSADYTCMRRDETTYNVSGKAFVITAVGFVIPLLLGIGLITTIRWQSGFANAASREMATAWLSSLQAASSPPAADLTVKLKQLQSAYEQNLITRDEYERKRDEIMRQF
jgi:hypothetical protein